MKVVYVSQYFVRGDQPGGVRHWHHTRALAARGHDVNVITSFVQHKERTVPEAYRGKKIVRETEDGLTMWRTYSTPGYGRDLRSRLANYLSFAWWATIAAFRAPRPGVIVASSPSLPAATGAAIVACVKRVPFVLEVRDLWPESAIAMGLVTRGSVFARVASALEHFCYRRAKHVIALTEGIRDGVIAKGVPPERVTVITNGVDPAPEAGPAPDFPVPDDTVCAMYVGAHGTYSSLETVLRTADLMRDDPRVRFVLVGGGDQKPRLQQMAADLDLPNVVFVDPVPKADVPAWLERADICLLPYQDKELFAGALPNKTFDYMGAGRPIVAAVPPGELSRLVHRAECGVAIAPEDPAGMAAAVGELAADAELRRSLGDAGQRYVREHYDRAVLASRFTEIAERVARR